MTRRIVYGVGFWVTLAATAMTLTSIILPNWISYSPDGGSPKFSYGLHKSCSAVKGSCTEFPVGRDCEGHNKEFCKLWRSIGFMMSMAVVLQLASLVAYIIVIAGGKQSRDKGWRMLVGLLGVVVALQAATMAIVAFLFDYDDRFFDGWRLDTSWILCTVSWSIMFITAVGLTSAAIYLPEEGGYELIPAEQ